MAGLRLPPRPPRHSPDAALAIVNIVLLLIFFFLATGSLLNSDSVEIALPQTTELPLDQLPKPLLFVDSAGEMTLDGAPVQPGDLNARLIDFPRLHVLADKELSAGRLLEIIAAEELIATEVKLVTLHSNVTIVEGGT
ncbi:MAG: biopolymer transporter ExbD [Pseudomonadota bacterium]